MEDIYGIFQASRHDHDLGNGNVWLEIVKVAIQS